MKLLAPARMSASVLALTLGQAAFGQETQADSSQMLEDLVAQCAEGGGASAQIPCTLVDMAANGRLTMPQLQEALKEAGVDLPGAAPEEVAEEPAAEQPAPAEEQPAPERTAETAEPPAPESSAPEQAAEPAPQPAQENTPPADVAEPAPQPAEDNAPPADVAEPAPQPAEDKAPPADVAEPAPQPAPETPPEADVAEPNVNPSPADQAPDVAASPDAQNAEVNDGDNAQAQQDAQAQADALADRNTAPPAAAAAADDNAQAERVEETVGADDVRRSDQDFDTSVTQAPEESDSDGDDNVAEARRRAATAAALLGIGAVALNEILGEDDRVVSNSGDRVVVERDGQFRVLRNDDVLLRRPGAEVQTDRFGDGSTRTILRYEDGSRVETIRAADGRVLRRIRVLPSGDEVVLFDDTQEQQEVVVNDLPQADDQTRLNFRDVNSDDLAAALAAEQGRDFGRTFSLNQVRNIDAVRQLVPEITVDTINFPTNSAAVRPEEARDLAKLGDAMRDLIARNPGEVFLIEGHTDAVGNYAYNLALSDRRAESVALALTEYFDVPPENMVLQGYGESDLMIETPEAERANRRVAVRRITPLLQTAQR